MRTIQNGLLQDNEINALRHLIQSPDVRLILNSPKSWTDNCFVIVPFFEGSRPSLPLLT